MYHNPESSGIKKGRIQQTGNGIKTRVTSLAQEVPSVAGWWTLEYAHGVYRTPVASFTEGKGMADELPVFLEFPAFRPYTTLLMHYCNGETVVQCLTARIRICLKDPNFV